MSKLIKTLLVIFAVAIVLFLLSTLLFGGVKYNISFYDDVFCYRIVPIFNNSNVIS